MPLYVPLDVDFATDPKFLAAGPLAGYLYISSLALAKRTMVDGVIERPQLAVIAIGLDDPWNLADKLVEVGLWTETSTGWRITGWLKRNKSRAQIVEAQKRKKEHAARANHERWHVAGKTSPTCPHCDPPTEPLTDRSTDPESIQSGLQVEEKEETKEEAEADLGIVERMIADELAARLERRRRSGEEIGPPLERLIRDDVVRDLTIILSEPTPKPALKRVFVCDVCSDTQQVRNDSDLSLPIMVPCPACKRSEEAEAS